MKSIVLTSEFGINRLVEEVTSVLERLDKKGYTIITVSHTKHQAIIYFKEK